MILRIKHWVPIAITIIALCGIIYLAVQQNIRQTANDPQIQMAEDLAVLLENGKSPESLIPANEVDISKSLAPYIIIFDDSGKGVASQAILDSRIPIPPPGVFEYTKVKGKDIFTWQPKPGVRSAAVIVHFNGAHPGFVLAGRSLREIEQREDNLLKIISAAGAAALIATFAAIYLLKI